MENIGNVVDQTASLGDEYPKWYTVENIDSISPPRLTDTCEIQGFKSYIGIRYKNQRTVFQYGEWEKHRPELEQDMTFTSHLRPLHMYVQSGDLTDSDFLSSGAILFGSVFDKNAFNLTAGRKKFYIDLNGCTLSLSHVDNGKKTHNLVLVIRVWDDTGETYQVGIPYDCIEPAESYTGFGQYQTQYFTIDGYGNRTYGYDQITGAGFVGTGWNGG